MKVLFDHSNPFLLAHGGFQGRHIFDTTDINGRRHDIGRSTGRYRRYPGLCFRETVGIQICDTDLHAETREPDRGGKTDAGRAAGDDGDIIW